MRSRALSLMMMAAFSQMTSAVRAAERAIPYEGPILGSDRTSFRHRYTKPAFHREAENRKYKAARRANRLRRKALS